MMLAEGISPALIENVAKHAGMPVGPLAVTDEVTLELSYHVMSQTKKALGDAYVAIGAIGKCVEAYKKALDLSRHHGLIDYEKENLSGLCFMMRVCKLQHGIVIVLIPVCGQQQTGIENVVCLPHMSS